MNSERIVKRVGQVNGFCGFSWDYAHLEAFYLGLMFGLLIFDSGQKKVNVSKTAITTRFG